MRHVFFGVWFHITEADSNVRIHQHCPSWLQVRNLEVLTKLFVDIMVCSDCAFIVKENVFCHWTFIFITNANLGWIGDCSHVWYTSNKVDLTKVISVAVLSHCLTPNFHLLPWLRVTCMAKSSSKTNVATSNIIKCMFVPGKGWTLGIFICYWMNCVFMFHYLVYSCPIGTQRMSKGGRCHGLNKTLQLTQF